MTVILMNWEDMTLVVSGHAGQAEKGQDIVCAGISALTQALVLTLQDAHNRGMVNLEYKIDEENGDLRVHVRPASGFSAEVWAYFRVIMRGLKGIQDAYPDYIKIGEVYTHGNL